MTVKELIEELKKYPDDMIVTDGSYIMDKVFIKEDFYNGDQANPKCEIIKSVLVID